MRFQLVYIREAHAIDGAWPMASPDGTVLFDPTTFAERESHASHCVQALDLAPIPAVIDDLDDTANRLYEAWPDRLLLIDRKGRVAYRSAPGPFGFEPRELERAIERELRREGGADVEG